MTERPKGMDIENIYCYQDAKLPSGSFYYIPGAPKAEPGSSGKPTLSLLVSDRGALLQLQTRWDVEGDVLNGVERQIAQRFPNFDAVSLRLAPLSSPQVSLMVGHGQMSQDGSEPEHHKILETAKSSGIFPYSTIFNIRLTAEEKNKVIAALNGNHNNLMIKYTSSISTKIYVQATIKGDIFQDIKDISHIKKEKENSFFSRINWVEQSEREKKSESTRISLTRCLEQINLALVAQRLTLGWKEIGNVSDELREKTSAEAKTLAAAKLLEMIQDAESHRRLPDKATIQITAKQTETKPYNLERVADVGAWFARETGTDLIQVSPIAIEEPVRNDALDLPEEQVSAEAGKITEKVVRLGFEARDTPLSRIVVTQGQKSRTLRRPYFRPVTLAGFAGTALEIDVQYQGTHKTFTSQLETVADEWVLSPEDLGLAKVTVDGSALKTQGARRARVSLAYDPDGDGVKDRTQLTFSSLDDEWVASWYVITASRTLNGVIEWALDRGDSMKTANPMIKLHLEA